MLSTHSNTKKYCLFLLVDKTIFKIQRFKEADLQGFYWRSQSMEQRLSAATEMTLAAYQMQVGFEPMDKKYTVAKKRNG